MRQREGGNRDEPNQGEAFHCTAGKSRHFATLPQIFHGRSVHQDRRNHALSNLFPTKSSRDSTSVPPTLLRGQHFDKSGGRDENLFAERKPGGSLRGLLRHAPFSSSLPGSQRCRHVRRHCGRTASAREICHEVVVRKSHIAAQTHAPAALHCGKLLVLERITRSARSILHSPADTS